MAKERILVAMSGGVDSSAAARLLLDGGAEIEGVTFTTDTSPSSEKAVADAAAVAAALGIRHTAVDVSKEFKSFVKEYFVRTYESGAIPNPCVVCNRKIKFGLLLDYAISHNFNGIATGHYANIRHQGSRTMLYKADSHGKDQSYVLAHVPERALSFAHFPLANYNKDEIRAIAGSAGLCTAEKKDSQDICFIPDGDYVRFMREEFGVIPQAGDFIDQHGVVLGKHNGQLCYTPGQRRGLGIAAGRRIFVISKDASTNTVTLGDEDELMQSRITARDLNLIGCDDCAIPKRANVKIRYAHREAPADIRHLGGDRIEITFDEPQRAPSSGQLAVLYENDDFGTRVIGGAIIE